MAIFSLEKANLHSIPKIKDGFRNPNAVFAAFPRDEYSFPLYILEQPSPLKNLVHSSILNSPYFAI